MNKINQEMLGDAVFGGVIGFCLGGMAIDITGAFIGGCVGIIIACVHCIFN